MRCKSRGIGQLFNNNSPRNLNLSQSACTRRHAPAYRLSLCSVCNTATRGCPTPLAPMYRQNTDGVADQLELVLRDGCSPYALSTDALKAHNSCASPYHCAQSLAEAKRHLPHRAHRGHSQTSPARMAGHNFRTGLQCLLVYHKLSPGAPMEQAPGCYAKLTFGECSDTETSLYVLETRLALAPCSVWCRLCTEG
jgi:hypothetical protein